MRVKICGLRSRAEAQAAAASGATYMGLVFYPPSPRSVTLGDARWIAAGAPAELVKVALIVNADDALVEAILEAVPVDLLQLHGAESPDRVAELRARTGLPVMKAVGVGSEADLGALAEHGRAADMLLVDARPAPDAALPGGNGVAFDWRLIRGRRLPVPWMLAGGLNTGNVAEAVRLTGAEQVDVSSGVEAEPGRKDPALIESFIRAATHATPAAAE